jgi:UDP-MurNAc hydroxylase
VNFNDCKLYDRLPAIANREGAPDVFTCQFSGATWHPTCYEYPEQEYEKISQKKMLTKFEAVVRAISVLQPRVYIPSAGPACFLDPALLHLNFQRVNIFPHAWTFLDYLAKRKPAAVAHLMMPGDVLDAATARPLREAHPRICAENYESALRSYADDYRSYFEMRQAQYAEVKPEEVLEQLGSVLRAKLSQLTLAERIGVPLYFGLTDAPGLALLVDFLRRTVSVCKTDGNGNDHYSIAAPSWEVARVLDGLLTW